MRRSNLLAVANTALLVLALHPTPGSAQSFLVDARAAFLVTAGEGILDRPMAQADAGVQFTRPEVGGPPAVALTFGVALGAGELGAANDVDLRFLGGVELPIAVRAFGEKPVEIVPVIQAGYQSVREEDERSGFTMRGTVGLRLFPGGDTFFFTFEPLSAVLLAPADPDSDASSSRFAVEFGILKVGWLF